MKLTPRSIFAAVFILIFLCVPLYAKWMDSSYYISLGSRILVYSLAAISLNLILGFGGMVSLGHAMYMLIGAYAVGLLAHHGVQSAYLHLLAAFAVTLLVAIPVGWVCLRTSGMAFIMITLAFAQMLFFVFVSLKKYGGDDGLTINARSDFGFIDIGQPMVLYYLLFVLVVIAMILVARWVESPFGLALRAGRSNARRANALGHPVMQVQWLAYVLSALICSVAGFGLANLTNFVSPAYGAWSVSGELIVMVVLGGMATYFGPWVGAAAFLVLEEILPALIEMMAPNYKSNWMLILGVVIILVALGLKKGIYGSLRGGRHD